MSKHWQILWAEHFKLLENLLEEKRISSMKQTTFSYNKNKFYMKKFIFTMGNKLALVKQKKLSNKNKW